MTCRDCLRLAHDGKRLVCGIDGRKIVLDTPACGQNTLDEITVDTNVGEV